MRRARILLLHSNMEVLIRFCCCCRTLTEVAVPRWRLPLFRSRWIDLHEQRWNLNMSFNLERIILHAIAIINEVKKIISAPPFSIGNFVLKLKSAFSLISIYLSVERIIKVRCGSMVNGRSLQFEQNSPIVCLVDSEFEKPLSYK